MTRAAVIWATYSPSRSAGEDRYVLAVQRAYPLREALKARGYYYDDDFWGYDVLAQHPMRVWRRDYPVSPSGYKDLLTEINAARALGIDTVKYPDALSSLAWRAMRSRAVEDILDRIKISEAERRQDDGSLLPVYHVWIAGDQDASAALQKIAGAEWLQARGCWSIPQRNLWREDAEIIVAEARQRLVARGESLG